MPGAIIVGQGGSGSGGSGGSNASVGATGVAAPAFATELGIIVAGNLVGVSAANPLPISGSITATNLSIGPTNAPLPADATLIGGSDYGGSPDLRPLKVDSSGQIYIGGSVALTVSQPTAANLNATVVGKIDIVGNTGATLDSTVGAGTAPANALAVSSLYNTTAPAPTNGQAMALQADQSGNLLNFPGTQFKFGAVWNNATALNTIQYPTGTSTAGQLSGAPAVLVQFDSTSTITAGAVTFQGTYDNLNWVTIPVAQVLNANNFTQQSNPFAISANTNQAFMILSQGYVSVRAQLTTAITGSGTVQPYWTVLSYLPASPVIVSSLTSVQGNLSNNNAAPTTNTQLGVLSAIANAAPPTWTEGDQVLESVDLSGNQRAIAVRGNTANASLASWTSATAGNTVATVLSNSSIYDSVVVTLNQAPTGTLTAGAVTFQQSLDGTNWENALPLPTNTGTATQNGVYTMVPAAYSFFRFAISGFKYFQVVLSTAITGTGTVTVGYVLQAGAIQRKHGVTFNKQTTIETTTPLSANAVYTGPWHDAQTDGGCFLTVSAYSNVASSAGGAQVQDTDDPTNANLSSNMASYTVAANTLVRSYYPLTRRYWRIVYTNGGSNQASFELTATSSSVPINSLDTGGGVRQVGFGNINYVNATSGTPLNNTTLVEAVKSLDNNAGPLANANFNYGGGFSGTASANQQAWSAARTPSVFKTVQATASGNTAIWTPGSGNKFRLLRYQIEGVNLGLTAAGVLTVSFQDATTGMNLAHDIYVPATATAGAYYRSGWIDLGTFGIQSAAANNVLNVNLSFALTGTGGTGNIRVNVCGTEE